MNVLILGGRGFIGSHLVQHFMNLGETTFICDVSEGCDERYFQLNHSEPDFDTLFRENAFDLCINASGSGNVGFSFQNQEEDFRLNALNVKLILEAILKYRPRCRFLQISSAAVYGNPIYLPIDEQHPLNPISPYGKHKLLSEQYCKDYFERADIRSCIVRPFSVYGPGLKKQLFWDIYQKSLGENPIELFGSGQESRDFVYIKDFASAIELIVKNDPFDAKAINVASGVEVSINQAANCFLKELKGKGNLVFTGKLKEGDPIVWKSNIEKLHNYGFTASYSIESGLGGYAEWLKNI